MQIGQLPIHFHRRPIIIVMGVSGCGKSTLAKHCAKHYRLPFIEGDDYHPSSNLMKLTAGIALNDEDRWPWLKRLSQAIKQAAQHNGGTVVSCSSLKKSYREFLLAQIGKPAVFVYLQASRDCLLQRVSQRRDHFMPTSLLDSQLDTLEEPKQDEPVVTLSANNTLESTLKALDSALNLLT